jgi:hypothetical protein
VVSVSGDGSAWYWGRNDYGQLGAAAGMLSAVPVKVTVW